MTYLYLINHFVPFPASEYGGVWSVIAQNDNECFDLITNHDDDLNKKHYVSLRQNISDSERFTLAENEKPRIIISFIT